MIIRQKMKTKDDYSKGAKITDDDHVFGPSNGGSAKHRSPPTQKNGAKDMQKK